MSGPLSAQLTFCGLSAVDSTMRADGLISLPCLALQLSQWSELHETWLRVKSQLRVSHCYIVEDENSNNQALGTVMTQSFILWEGCVCVGEREREVYIVEF